MRASGGYFGTITDTLNLPPVPNKSVASARLLEGLWAMLPGDGPLAKADRERWLAAAEAILILIYGVAADETEGEPRS